MLQLCLDGIPPPAIKPNRKKRVANDFYPTDARLVSVLRKHVPIADHELVLEPCAGDGAIARCFPRCETCDIKSYPRFTPDHLMDMTQRTSWIQLGPRPWIVTNPPYNLADQIVPLAFEFCTKGIAMLLRLSWQEPCEGRAEWLKANRRLFSHNIILNPRPQFRSDTKGGDSVTSAWMVWQRGRVGGTQIEYETDWKNEEIKLASEPTKTIVERDLE